ncbi:MAG: thioredoxin family protein [Phycisphaeraceae bacterium]|nr:thioredoxin family protein [Phycisphaeraceae bacterium]
MDEALLRRSFEAADDYATYLASDPGRAEPWKRAGEGVALTPPQRALVEGFTREMKVLVVSGIWCGDCSAQGPLLEAIAAANRRMIDLRWVDRDEHGTLADMVMICGGRRVPTVIFMGEDFSFISLLGDRTLSRYRAMAARQLGPSCPVPGAAVDREERSATLQEWLNEFERVQLLLRLSPRLRALHQD